MTFIDFLYKLDGWVWGTPLIVLIMVVGIYYMVKGKFFPFVHFRPCGEKHGSCQQHGIRQER